MGRWHGWGFRRSHGEGLLFIIDSGKPICRGRTQRQVKAPSNGRSRPRPTAGQGPVQRQVKAPPNGRSRPRPTALSNGRSRPRPTAGQGPVQRPRPTAGQGPVQRQVKAPSNGRSRPLPTAGQGPSQRQVKARPTGCDDRLELQSNDDSVIAKHNLNETEKPVSMIAVALHGRWQHGNSFDKHCPVASV
eukprot:scaffold1112_cov92-Amphora_coffeaeformis.AAC.29